MKEWRSTAFLAFLSPAGDLEWSSAGHGPVFLRAGLDLPLEALNPTVPPLGVVEEWDSTQAPHALSLPSGGSLVVVSDGIFEAMDAAGDQFGIERMTSVLDLCRSSTPEQTVAALRSAVKTHLAGEEPADDQTIVVVRRH